MNPPCTRMNPHPFFEATSPGAAPGPPVKTGARVRHFRGCNYVLPLNSSRCLLPTMPQRETSASGQATRNLVTTAPSVFYMFAPRPLSSSENEKFEVRVGVGETCPAAEAGGLSKEHVMALLIRGEAMAKTRRLNARSVASATATFNKKTKQRRIRMF